MKRCPICNRAFDDDTLSFCLEDGTPLVADLGPRPDSQETLVSPRLPGAEAGSPLPPTQAYSQLPGKATVSQPSYQSPATQPYGPAISKRKRKTWPWVIAILAILSILAAAIVAAFTLPGLLRASNTNNRPSPSPSRPVSSVTRTPSESPASDVPTDSAKVLAQLTKLEKEWTEANIKGDKQALEKILADEYVSNEENSRTKRQYIDSLKPDTSVENWEVYDVTVNQTGDRAAVNGSLKEETSDETYVYDFVDTFVWRDHRWEAVTSHATRVK